MGKNPIVIFEPFAKLTQRHIHIGHTLLVNADSFVWMGVVPEESISAIVTDPPYGVKEYLADQLEKRNNGRGGIWRLPPSYDGHKRAPLPRFTALNQKERAALSRFFVDWSRLAVRILKPGGHVFIAGNAFLSQLTYAALVEGGLEFRGEVIRLLRTLRGGDRPKNGEREFPQACSTPRGCFEPWGIFRKPFSGTVVDCLRQHGTGAIRRLPNGNPFCDVIPSEKTPRRERLIANHPSIKPQSFMRQIVHASLPLGDGVILDPFAGSGSTLAAAEAMGLHAIGVELYPDYYALAEKAILALASLKVVEAKSNGRQDPSLFD